MYFQLTVFVYFFYRTFVDIIDNKRLIASVFTETEEIIVNSIDYKDETVLRFRKPTITTDKQTKLLPKMLPVTNSHHGILLADFLQFQHMKECPFYTIHHPYFGNETHSEFTNSNFTGITLKKRRYKFKADEEETLEQAKEIQDRKDFFLSRARRLHARGTCHPI